MVAPERLAPPRLNDECRSLSYFRNGKYHRCDSELRIHPVCLSAHKLFLILTLVSLRCSDAVFFILSKSLASPAASIHQVKVSFVITATAATLFEVISR